MISENVVKFLFLDRVVAAVYERSQLVAFCIVSQVQMLAALFNNGVIPAYTNDMKVYMDIVGVPYKSFGDGTIQFDTEFVEKLAADVAAERATPAPGQPE